MNKQEVRDEIKLRGFFRLQLEENGKIVGDSDWVKNAFADPGKQDYLCALLGNTTGSKQVGFIAVGTGTQPGSADVALQGELATNGGTKSRKTVTVSVSQSTKVRFTATLASADSHVSATQTIRNIGLFAHSTTDNIFAGNTYTTSQVQTNQNINCTYDITF